MTNSCYNCGECVREVESWELEHIYWYECDAVPGMANLRNFPFSNTKCKHFVKSQHPVRRSVYESVDVFANRLVEASK